MRGSSQPASVHSNTINLQSRKLSALWPLVKRGKAQPDFVNDNFPTARLA
jgi:hypothetical protein